MRTRVIASSAIVLCLWSCAALAQTCKPDISYQDKISKEHLEYWKQDVSPSSMTIWIFIGGRTRLGTELGVRIAYLSQAQTSNTTFQSARHATKGDHITFALKNGSPLEFVATDVLNDSKVSGSFKAGLTGKNLQTDFQLWAVVSDNDLVRLRDTLTHRQIDALRIALTEGGTPIERSLSDKDGAKIMEKFGCFFQSLDKKGIDLQAAAPAPRQDEPKASTQLTIDQIIQMVRAKIPDDIVISSIQKSGSKFDLTPEILIKLKTAGVSDAVLRAMAK
jgi:hypothetical protein